MSTRRDDGTFFILMLGALVMIGILIMAAFDMREQTWTEGYCTALGGERILDYTCEINGRVLRI